MNSSWIIAIQIIANSIIMVMALGLYYMAYLSFKRQRKAEQNELSKVMRTIFGYQPKERRPAPYSEEEHTAWLREMGESEELIPFGDWLAKRRGEVKNEP